jgi:hypothetical protein
VQKFSGEAQIDLRGGAHPPSKSRHYSGRRFENVGDPTLIHFTGISAGVKAKFSKCRNSRIECPNMKFSVLTNLRMEISILRSIFGKYLYSEMKN